MNKLYYFSLILPIFLTIFISCFFIPILQTTSQNSFTNNFASNSNNFIWPLNNYTKITSSFGYRTSPITNKKSYHGGIDIAAPQNTPILSIEDGTVFYIGWYGANGYTVIIEHENLYKSIYGHISPNFLVSVGDSIEKGTIIAKVGPKYIEKETYTTYQDITGKYTNGATTRSTSAFCNHER